MGGGDNCCEKKNIGRQFTWRKKGKIRRGEEK
jgi:hypothetical protein